MLLAVPALRALAAAGGAPLTLAAQPRIGRLLAALGLVGAALDVEALRLHRLFTGEAVVLEEGEPLRVLLGSGAPAAPAVVSWFGAGDPRFVAGLRALAPRAIVAPPHVAGRPTWEHLLETVGGERDVESLRAPVVVSPALLEAGCQVLGRLGWRRGTPFLVVHPGAGGVAKRWPAEGFAEVLEAMVAAERVTLVLHEGPADHAAVAALVDRLRVPALRLVEPDLEALAGVLAGASAYLGNDSGVSHLAAAVGAPAVVLFTREALDWRPWALPVDTVLVTTAAPRAADLDRVRAAMRACLGRNPKGNAAPAPP